jgi:hypothetical protein
MEAGPDGKNPTQKQLESKKTTIQGAQKVLDSALADLGKYPPSAYTDAHLQEDIAADCEREAGQREREQSKELQVDFEIGVDDEEGAVEDDNAQTAKGDSEAMEVNQSKSELDLSEPPSQPSSPYDRRRG